MDSQIGEFADLKNDRCFKLLHMDDNEKRSTYHTTNFRNNFCKTDFYNGPYKHLDVYNGLGVSNGKVGGCNIITDDALTRGQITARPDDKLMESRKYEAHSFNNLMPNPKISSNVQMNGFCDVSMSTNSCDFLTSTSVGYHPQENFDARFDYIGVNSRNYGRKDSTYYKNMGQVNFNKSLGPHGRYSK